MSRRGKWNRPLEERLLTKIAMDAETGCWVWTGTKTSTGYGVIHEGGVDGGRRLRAHRVAYELFVGPIPEGLVLDHLCRNPLCVNPEHLEPVTIGENVRRGEPPNRTQCPRGHAYDDDNTYRRPSGGRVCRTCARELRRERSVA